MPRIKTPSFIAEFPLHTTAADEAALDTRLDAARNIYNAALGESLRRLDLMRESLEWRAACAMPKGDPRSPERKARAAAFKAAQARFGFGPGAIQKFCEGCRDACWIGDHLGSHDTQTTSLRAFRAVEQYAFGTRGRPRFKGKGRLHSIEGKGDAVIRYRVEPAPAVHYSGLVMPLMLDRKDKRGWQATALDAPTKYVRIVRRIIRGHARWFCQLVQQGAAPLLREPVKGVVGLDIGPSTIAAVSGDDAILERLCPEVAEPWQEIRRIQRAMDRSRRAANTENFSPDGTVRKGSRLRRRSERYKRRQRHKAEAERKLAARRKRAHGQLANRILGQGSTIKTEKLSYKSFQKNFGRSVKVRAPGMLVSTLRRKAEGAGGAMVEINTRRTALSQFDHTTAEYVKKPLSQRIHVFGDGRTEPIQRDLYSAFLASCCAADTLDIRRVQATWPAAQPLLRRAMARINQPASGRGFPSPRVRTGLGAGRPSKGDGRTGEAADAVALARAAESLSHGSLRTPWL
jgi:putative transposase